MVEADKDEWRSIGEHSYCCERMGVLFIRVSGDISQEDLAVFTEEFSRHCEGRDSAFWLLDLSQMGAMSPGARKYFATTPPRPENRGMAVYGASFRQRTIFTVVNAATVMLQRKVPPLAFFNTEPEARAWINERRQRLSLSITAS